MLFFLFFFFFLTKPLHSSSECRFGVHLAYERIFFEVFSALSPSIALSGFLASYSLLKKIISSAWPCHHHPLSFWLSSHCGLHEIPIGSSVAPFLAICWICLCSSRLIFVVSRHFTTWAVDLRSSTRVTIGLLVASLINALLVQPVSSSLFMI